MSLFLGVTSIMMHIHEVVSIINIIKPSKLLLKYIMLFQESYGSYVLTIVTEYYSSTIFQVCLRATVRCPNEHLLAVIIPPVHTDH